MEFDELLITTGVDALVRLVKEKQRVEIENISLTLNIPQQTIEEWARVLEEEGILRIEYRLTKVYLVWVKPTEEEVAIEKQSFYEEKKDIEGEVKKFQDKITTERSELGELNQSFSDFYEKAYAKIEKIEKTIAPLPAAKMIREDRFSKSGKEIEDMEGQVEEIKNAISEIKDDISGLSISNSGSKQLLDEIEAAKEDIEGLNKQMDEIRRKGTKQDDSEISMPTVKDIKKKFETVQKEFTALRSKNAQMRQDMISLHESSEILKSVAESIMGQEDKVGNLREDVRSLSKDAEKLMERATAVATRVKQNVELVDRVGDSVEVAKSILKKFPSQDKVMEELDGMRAEEETLVEKNRSLEKILEATGGKQVTSKQFGELLQRIDERSRQIRKDMDALETALADEKNTYLTFQKIKERINPAIDGYQKQLGDIEKRISKIKDDTEDEMDSIKADSEKLQESLKGGQMQSIVKVAEDITEKKKTLDEIKDSIEELTTLSDNLNKRITLLSREAKLLEIRTSSDGSSSSSDGDGGRSEGEIRNQLKLSQDEELEFRKKREELKRIIQKLWE